LGRFGGPRSASESGSCRSSSPTWTRYTLSSPHLSRQPPLPSQ
jgi:hypothetical protein